MAEICTRSGRMGRKKKWLELAKHTHTRTCRERENRTTGESSETRRKTVAHAHTKLPKKRRLHTNGQR